MNNPDLEQERQRQLRAAAEARLDSVPDTASHATDQLLHELQVHQIELEIQNEELRQAQIALEASRAHYVELYDFAPVGYLTLTAEGLIAQMNITGVKLLDRERMQLINKRFAAFIADNDKDRWYRFYQRALQQTGKQSIELLLHRSKSKAFHAQLDCLRMATGSDSPTLLIAFIDITERKNNEDSLRIAAAAFETQEGIIVTDANQRILRVNQAFTRITGYCAGYVLGKKPDFLRSRLHDTNFYQDLWTTLASHGFWQGEIWDKRKNGEIFPVWQTITVVTDAEGVVSHYVGSMIDITGQKQAEKVLMEARERLENQVASTKDELETIKRETVEINTALNVLLKHREFDKADAQIALSRQVESTVLPLLKTLKGLSAGRYQSARLIGVLESSLQELVKSYGRADNLAGAYQRLSPVEKQVASMVRQGIATKVIAGILNLSPETISIHRKHIRKKLGLDSKATNLSSYLASLSE